MKLRSLSIIICSLFVTAQSASAFPGLSGIVDVGIRGGNGGSNVSQVVFDCGIALDLYLDAQVLLIRAIAGKEELAARQATIDFVENGDAKKASNDEKAKMGRELDESLNRVVAENRPLDDHQKRLATEGALRYVIAVSRTYKLVGSVSRIDVKAIGIFDAPGVLYLINNLPAVASNAVSTTGKLFKYLSANNVDISKAQKAADGLGV
ncbi:MAG: hypothetical protein HGB22_07695 [Chlorobiaceae bacterium]|nr:hypothetical protein [Chlorobiaceae bacterium]